MSLNDINSLSHTKWICKYHMWIWQERTKAELQSTSKISWKRISWANNSRWVKLTRLWAVSNSPCASGRPYYTFDVSARTIGLCLHMKYPQLCWEMFIIQEESPPPGGLSSCAKWGGLQLTGHFAQMMFEKKLQILRKRIVIWIFEVGVAKKLRLLYNATIYLILSPIMYHAFDFDKNMISIIHNLQARNLFCRRSDKVFNESQNIHDISGTWKHFVKSQK